jgi:hypothetical protein
MRERGRNRPNYEVFAERVAIAWEDLARQFEAEDALNPPAAIRHTVIE